MRAIIAGGGIAGLTTALELSRIGVEVAVYEAAPEISPLGVGINLLPHSVRILADLGLQDRLLGKGVATGELVYFNRFGQRIWGEPRGRFAGYPWPQISLHRGALQMTLLEAARERLGADIVRLDRRLTGFRQEGDEVEAAFTDAAGGETRVRGDMLLACDGIHSAARRILNPAEGPPVYGGRILWRGVTRARPFLTGATMIMAGHQNQKFVCYPLEAPGADGLQPINWIAELAEPQMPNREDWNRPGRLEDFAPQFADWNFGWLDAAALIRDAQSVFEYPLVDRDPLERWTHGRVTLVGDAAHPMYPIGSNGASQGILDARALAEALRADADVGSALAAYDAARRPPTAAIVLANRGNGPEQCMQLAHERAPDGFADIEDVIPRAELEAIAARYKQVAGFSKEALAATNDSEKADA
ncbi:flavin-dependent oxidoreductase [Phenylobacterium soli]|uniref:Flavin-dependent oxidoreductase n=1 Tax=Phenylobacterium soli TaxID=2170551 RepID=A0A328AG56_9CAUL|nr:flavin-dependent oxidoreductase [Phenylobacterium soli]RAK51788.1 flavin-dependent oxidoreductase [Phenylobacterium soli]